MKTYRLTFDIDISDDISEEDINDFEEWLDFFEDTVKKDICYDNPLDCDIDVNSDWEEI